MRKQVICVSKGVRLPCRVPEEIPGHRVEIGGWEFFQ